MAVQFLLNRGFEDKLEHYATQGNVSLSNSIAYSGLYSARMTATPEATAELSQVLGIIPGLPLKFSFFAMGKNYTSEAGQSNVRAEVKFINTLGYVVPPGIMISVRGCDVSNNTWNHYEEYGTVPADIVTAQVVIRLEPPAEGSCVLLIDDMALTAGY